MQVGNPEPSLLREEGVETLRGGLAIAGQEKVQTTNARAASKDEVGNGFGCDAHLESVISRTKVNFKAIVAMYESGLSAPKIARQLGLGVTTAYRALKRAGIKPKTLAKYQQGRRDLLTEAQKDELVDRYENEKLSLNQIGKIYGCCLQTVRNALLRRGVKMAPKGNRYREFSPSEIAEMKRLYESGMAQSAIGEAFHADQTIVSKVLRENGIKPRGRPATGERHGMWKGGSITVGGYRYVHIPASHRFYSMAQRGGAVAEHRLRLAEKVGRPLESHETVHHINGDRLDNRLDNLQLISKKHGSGVSCYCADCGSNNIVYEKLEDNSV